MSEAIDRLVEVVGALREHCPWTRALTHAALTEYLVEEAYEALEAIESGADDAALRAELGDVLFQVVLHSAIAHDRGAFDLAAVAETITAKMVRRNPHVFTAEGRLRPPEQLARASVEQIERDWERIKAEEKRAQAGSETGTEVEAGDSAASGAPADPAQAVFAGLPPHLPALAAAGKAVDRAARLDPDPLAAADGASATGPASSGAVLADEEALGAHLFDLAAAARRAGLDPERALRRHLAGRAGRVG